MSGKHKLIQGYQPQQHHAISTSNTIVRTESNTSMDKTIILRKKNLNVPLAGRLKHFSTAWEILTKDQRILSYVSGYQILFLKQPKQNKLPQTPYI